MAADLTVTRNERTVTQEGSWRATSLDTPLGPLVAVAGSRGVVAADIGVPVRAFLRALEGKHDVDIRRDEGGLSDLRADARSYFGRRPRPLAYPVDLSIARTAFWKGIYEATIAVPFGELRTYGDVAAAAGNPRAWRAAGHALRHCPVELWIPCHRVVPAGPDLGSYGGRPDVRTFLLRHEGVLPAVGSPRRKGRSAVGTGR